MAKVALWIPPPENARPARFFSSASTRVRERNASSFAVLICCPSLFSFSRSSLKCFLAF